MRGIRSGQVPPRLMRAAERFARWRRTRERDSDPQAVLDRSGEARD